MKVNIYTIKTINKIQWKQMVDKEGIVSQSYEWAMLENNFSVEPLFFVAKDSRGKWIGGWLVFYSNYWRPKCLSHLLNKLVIPSEPVILEKNKKEEVLQALWLEIETFAKKNHIIYIDWYNLVHSRWKDREFLFNKSFKRIRGYVSYILDISQPEEQLWKGIHKKHRNVIRKAEKKGVIVEENNNLGAYYSLSEQTYTRSEGHCPSYKYLKAIFDNLNPEGMCRMFFAKCNNEILAASLMLFCGDKVLYLHGASAPKTDGASNLLHWETIKKLKAEGYKWYDFTGASLDLAENSKAWGINRFKERFGGELQIFYGGYRIYSPARKFFLENVISPAIIILRYLYSKFGSRK